MKWSSLDKKVVLGYRALRFSYDQIANKMGRTQNAIIAQLSDLKEKGVIANEEDVKCALLFDNNILLEKWRGGEI